MMTVYPSMYLLVPFIKTAEKKVMWWEILVKKQYGFRLNRLFISQRYKISQLLIRHDIFPCVFLDFLSINKEVKEHLLLSYQIQLFAVFWLEVTMSVQKISVLIDKKWKRNRPETY